MVDADPLFSGVPAHLILGIVAVLVTTESALIAGVVLPGSTALLTAGFLAARGIVPLGGAVLVGAVAAAAGGQLSFLAARRACPGAMLDRAYRRWCRSVGTPGCRVLLASQWVVGARTLMPRLLHAAGVRHADFSRWQLPTAASWGASVVVLGELAGAAYRDLASGMIVGGCAIVASTATMTILRRRLRGRA